MDLLGKHLRAPGQGKTGLLPNSLPNPVGGFVVGGNEGNVATSFSSVAAISR